MWQLLRLCRLELWERGLSEPYNSEARMRSLIRDGAGNLGESTSKVPNSRLPFPSPVIFTKPQIVGITMAIIWIRKITFRLDSKFRVPALFIASHRWERWGWKYK